jgi:hypothetical protein
MILKHELLLSLIIVFIQTSDNECIMLPIVSMIPSENILHQNTFVMFLAFLDFNNVFLIGWFLNTRTV